MTAEAPSASVAPCPGPLIWYHVGPRHDGLGAVLECACCDYVVITGGFNDAAHENTPTMSEGLAA